MLIIQTVSDEYSVIYSAASVYAAVAGSVIMSGVYCGIQWRERVINLAPLCLGNSLIWKLLVLPFFFFFLDRSPLQCARRITGRSDLYITRRVSSKNGALCLEGRRLNVCIGTWCSTPPTSLCSSRKVEHCKTKACLSTPSEHSRRVFAPRA